MQGVPFVECLGAGVCGRGRDGIGIFNPADKVMDGGEGKGT